MLTKDSHTILEHFTIRQAIEKLTSLGENLTLFVIDTNQILLGVITDGDLRRGLIKGYKLDDVVSLIMNKNFKYLIHNKFSLKFLNDLKSSSVKIIPVLNSNKKIIRFINLDDLKTILPLDVIIIAGGKGERLLPLTKMTPKPMLKVNGKPLIEHNIDFLYKYGITNFHVSVNYLKNIIMEYLGDGSNKNININYIIENVPLGTIGSIKLEKKYINSDLLIINSDVLTNINIEDFYFSFKKSKADMSIATSNFNVSVPYAILNLENGRVKSLKEKPIYNYPSNAGIYLLKSKLIDVIPENKFFNATDLINSLLDLNKKVISFPIVGYWLDIGRHEDYIKAEMDYNQIIF